ncbi:hypothetical protein PG984_007242, partial [Apiospora sp. TS-2023a]
EVPPRVFLSEREHRVRPAVLSQHEGRFSLTVQDPARARARATAFAVAVAVVPVVTIVTAAHQIAEATLVSSPKACEKPAPLPHVPARRLALLTKEPSLLPMLSSPNKQARLPC